MRSSCNFDRCKYVVGVNLTILWEYTISKKGYIVMDNTLPRNTRIHILGGLIEEITTDDNSTLVTVAYAECPACSQRDQRVRLVVGDRTLIYDRAGNRITAQALQVGMLINAVFSSTMTRSIPPQATAYRIRIVSNPSPENITEGRIIDIDRQNRSFTIISNANQTSVIRFIVPENAIIRDIFGRQINFSDLVAGLRVRVRHAGFMTASIPPQTTAFEVQVIK